jgi:hypothetical protein
MKTGKEHREFVDGKKGRRPERKKRASEQANKGRWTAGR